MNKQAAKKGGHRAGADGIDRNRDACLVHIHANILSVIHLGAPFRRSRADASSLR